MTRTFAIFAALAVAGFAAVEFSPAVGQSGDGWTQLCDGKTLGDVSEAWKGNWLVGVGSILADQGKVGHLVSKNQYKNHIIYAEFWSDEKANSGIFVRCKDPKKIGAKDCYEMNIFDTRPDQTY